MERECIFMWNYKFLQPSNSSQSSLCGTRILFLGDKVWKNRLRCRRNKKSWTNIKWKAPQDQQLLTCFRWAEVTVVVECFDLKWGQLSAVHVYFIQCVDVSDRSLVFTKSRIAVPVFWEPTRSRPLLVQVAVDIDLGLAALSTVGCRDVNPLIWKV